MQRDFHFYCTAVLARAAGFNAADALTIAYAAQYVDNANEDEKFKLTLGGKPFDFIPHKTSHNLSQGLKEALYYNEDLAYPVWIPFHFPPGGEPGLPMITEKNSPLINSLFEKAGSERDRRMKLIQVGVAAHTYADSWAHEGFSGELSRVNRVDTLAHYNRGRREWVPMFSAPVPAAGHAQAVHVPDLPFLWWKCKIGGREVNRDNTVHFLEAAEMLHGQFRTIRSQYSTYQSEPIPERGKSRDWMEWEKLGPRILVLLRGRLPRDFSVEADMRTSLDNRCQNWKNTFARWFETAEKPPYLDNQEIPEGCLYDYDMNACRKAVFGDQIWSEKAWEGEYAVKISAAAFKKSFWACFHIAAKKQHASVIAYLNTIPHHS